MASFSTELNYLIRRKYKESQEVLSFNYLQYISKQCGVKSCSLKEMDEVLHEGNYLDDTFKKLVKIEDTNFKKTGRGLCYQHYLKEVEMNSLSTNDPSLYFAPIKIINYYLENDKNISKVLEQFPFLNTHKCKQEENNKLLACALDDYISYFNPQALKVCSSGAISELISRVDEILENKSDENMFDVFQPLMEKSLNCDGNLSKEPILSEMKSHHGVLKKINGEEVIVKPKLLKEIDKQCRAAFKDNFDKADACSSKLKEQACREKKGCRPMWDFYENALSHPNVNARRPITIGASMKIFRPVADIFGFVRDPLDGHHAMVAIGTATCEKKKCLLLQNSWGSDVISEDKNKWEDSYKLRSVYPYKIDSNGKMDYSRMWVCGDELIKESIKQINYIQSYRPLL